MYGTELSVQTENLMPFIGLGFVLGLLYDILRIIRTALRQNKVFVFVADFCFCIFVTVASYLLLLGTANGFIRIYLIAAETLGAVVYFMTFGTVVSVVISFLSCVLRKVFAPFFRLKKTIKGKMKKIKEKLLKNTEKVKNKFKKTLERYRMNSV